MNLYNIEGLFEMKRSKEPVDGYAVYSKGKLLTYTKAIQFSEDYYYEEVREAKEKATDIIKKLHFFRMVV